MRRTLAAGLVGTVAGRVEAAGDAARVVVGPARFCIPLTDLEAALDLVGMALDAIEAGDDGREPLASVPLTLAGASLFALAARRWGRLAGLALAVGAVTEDGPARAAGGRNPHALTVPLDGLAQFVNLLGEAVAAVATDPALALAAAPVAGRA